MNDSDSGAPWIWFFQIRLIRPFHADTFRQAREALLASCLRQGFTQEVAWDLAAAADELLCNVLEHSDAKWLDLGACQNALDGMLRLRLLDNGQRFDVAMAAAKGPGATAPLDKHLGLAMLQGLGKSLNYRELPEGGNELVVNFG